MENNISQPHQLHLGAGKNYQPQRLERTLSGPEAGGFGLSGLLLWLGTAPGMHAALGPGAMLVWFPGAIIGILLNLQVHRLGMHYPDISGGTPNYTTQLLKDNRFLACYGAIGYFIGWVSVPSINAIILTDLIKSLMTTYHVTCPETLLKIGFTAVPFILAFSGIQALSILHLFFILPAIGFLVVFCVQGLGWLAFSPASPGFFPNTEVLHSTLSLSFVDWAKWFFIAIYAVYGCESASAFVADSKQTKSTLRFLKLAAALIPIVYLGGSWVLMRLDTGLDGHSSAFLSLLAAASPFWGKSASVLVTFLIVSGVLLSSATAVSVSPRVLYQLAIDGYLSPVFTVLSRRNAFIPGLTFTLSLSLICLVWGDVSRVVMVTGTSYVTAMMAIHLGLWLRRNQPEVFAPWCALGFFLIEFVVLVVGGFAWNWRDLLVGLLLPIAIIIFDAVICRIQFAPFHPAWWLKREPQQVYNPQKDFFTTQVIVLLLLVCGSISLTWFIRGFLDKTSNDATNNFFVILLVAIAFFCIAIASWTSLPQVAAIDQARKHAENIFITALDTVPDTILVIDNNAIIRQANPAAELLLGIPNHRLIGQSINHFFPDLSIINLEGDCREQILENSPESRIIEATISQRSQQSQEYIVILRDITERKQAKLKLEQAFQIQEKIALEYAAQAEELEKTLHNLQSTQSQLIQTEKMSSLGQLVAGVAHEINNPINFIYGNLNYADEYIQKLLSLIDLYQKQNYHNREIDILVKDIELEFILEDLPKILSSMKMGTDRIREIVLTLRNFSRLDEAAMKLVNIHEGIDSTLLILRHRLQGKRSIEIIEEYEDLPKIECYPGQLNQVFMNILNNAIDALEELSGNEIGKITIKTSVLNLDWVRISIKDNGSGIKEEIINKLFDPFFTTKPVGKGTGLGLSISYQIIVEKHKGILKCISAPGEGTEFVIEIPIQQNVKS